MLRFGSLGGGKGGLSPSPPEVGEVLPRLAFPTSLLKEKWLSPSLLDEAFRRTTLPRSHGFGDSSVAVSDMNFQENREAEEEGGGCGNGERER